MRYYRGRFPPVMLPVFNQAQYAEGLRAQIRALEAQLVQLDGQLATEKRAPPNAYQLRSSAGAILDVVEQMRPSGTTLVSMLQVALAVATESRRSVSICPAATTAPAIRLWEVVRRPLLSPGVVLQP